MSSRTPFIDDPIDTDPDVRALMDQLEQLQLKERLKTFEANKKVRMERIRKEILNLGGTPCK